MRMLMVPCTVSDRTCVRRDTQHILRETRAKIKPEEADDNEMLPCRPRAVPVVFKDPHVSMKHRKRHFPHCSPGASEARAELRQPTGAGSRRNKVPK